LVDIFYIGGTKNGALFGEAIVITHPKLKDHFRYYLKQKGALLAKGRVLGIQFLELFKDDLFFQLAQHANQMAELLAQGIQNQQYSFLSIPQTNQIFPILPNHLIEQLQTKYGFYIWKKIDEHHSVIRLVTSWATKEKDIEGFILELKQA
jgi:threonine aldolase